MAKKTKKKVNKKVSKQEKKGRIIYAIVILFAFVFSLVVIITNLAEIRAKRREKIDDVNDEVERLSSEKSGQIQIIDSIKIFNIEIITSGEGTEVLSTVQNNTQEVLGDFEVIIKLKDEIGNIIYAYGYVPEMQPNTTIQVSSEINRKIGNIKEVEYYKY